MTHDAMMTEMKKAGKVRPTCSFYELELTADVAVSVPLAELRLKSTKVSVNLFTSGILVHVGDSNDKLSSHFMGEEVFLKVSCGFLTISEGNRTIMITLEGDAK